MVPPPTAIALILCEKVIIEEGSRRLTFVSSFTKLAVPRFPSPPQAFMAIAALTDGAGDATIKLIAEDLANLEEVYSDSRTIRFPDRLTEVQIVFQVQDCCLPRPSRYQFTLLADGMWVAQRRLRVVVAGDSA